MGLRIRWLRTALLNLDAEAPYIAAEDPVADRLVVTRILDAVSLLAHHPAMGRPGRVPGTRELPVPRMHYLIPYRVRTDQVEILRVFHTSRKPVRRW